MNDTTKQSLETIEVLLVRNFTSPKEALQAAYRLGVFDGMLEMSRIGQEKVGEVMKESA